MGYDIRTGIQHRKVNMKKVIVAGVVSLAATGAMAIPAFAAGGANSASPCGAVHGAFNYQNSVYGEGTTGINGNSSTFGQGGGAGFNAGPVGQQPGATGSNNSHTSCQV